MKKKNLFLLSLQFVYNNFFFLSQVKSIQVKPVPPPHVELIDLLKDVEGSQVYKQTISINYASRKRKKKKDYYKKSKKKILFQFYYFLQIFFFFFSFVKEDEGNFLFFFMFI